MNPYTNPYAFLAVPADCVVVQYPTFAELRAAVLNQMRLGFAPFGPPVAEQTDTGLMLRVEMVRFRLSEKEYTAEYQGRWTPPPCEHDPHPNSGTCRKCGFMPRGK